MYLSSVILHGFKSFADKTVLDLEPGITVVVGPNGSGKSNVVDALTWVLGSHSAKSLRGGQMADVIFAGSPERRGFGRASVEIVIDNAAGTLPVDYSEVRVSRSMFASGETEYAINGEACRQLDIAELLSDTGLGREHHQIVGQGRLEAILSARPEDRRAFIEEAAGILKHRRRKERSLRKLAQTEAHLERLTDVLGEVKRSLKPLERQARLAEQHESLSTELAGVRRARALRELDGLLVRLDGEREERASADAALAGLEERARAAREEEAGVEQAVAALAPQVEAAAATHFRLANLVERYRGLEARIEERRRGLSEAVEEPVAGRDPEALREEAAEERLRLSTLESEVDDAARTLEEATAEREEAERRRRAHEQAAAAEARRRNEARERHLRWEGEVAALRSALAQAASEQGRLASQIDGLTARRGELARDVDAVQAEIQRLDTEAPEVAERHAAAEALVRRRADTAAEVAREERDLERRRASLEARADALRAASEEATGGQAALLEAVDAGRVAGIRGPLAEQMRVADGMAQAVAAALGALGDALVADSARAAAGAVGFVREEGSGRVLLLAAGAPSPPRDAERDARLAAERARPLIEALEADGEVLAGLAAALADVYAVGEHETACRLAEAEPGCAFVTPRGELAGALGYAGGSAAPSSAVVSRAAAEQAEAELEEVGRELAVVHRRVGDADRELEAARGELDAATAALQESDAAITAAAERLGRLRKELAAAERQLAEREAEAGELEGTIAERRDRLEVLEARGADDLPPDDAEEGPDLEAERLDDALTRAREAEVQARLEASAATQRRNELARRIDALVEEAQAVEAQVAERERRREARLAGIRRCGELRAVAVEGLARAERSLAEAASERGRLEEARAGRQGELGVLRARLREVEAELTEARDARHREDLARRELELAAEEVRRRLVEDLGVEPDAALAEAREAGEDGPLAGGDDADAALAEEEQRLARKLNLLGAVNPHAQREHAELSERHDFLESELADVRRSRADLAKVIDAVDGRIRSVFAEAFHDVAQAFAELFPRLFPGGEGRLVLTDPDDLLDTGVEVEARPPGKRVKRLSLLSGGERSLTALAILFAIFRARPSPFYVLDEVEAALDDVNLQRFLTVVAEFRETSQLILVTHQKRTMEVADLLYGVSMHSSGVSRVISQRMGEQPSAAAS